MLIWQQQISGGPINLVPRGVRNTAVIICVDDANPYLAHINKLY